MARNHLVEDILDLCDEQGFRYTKLSAGNGVKVFPRDVNMPAAVFYFTTSENSPSREANLRALARRIGIKFPIDAARSRVRDKPKETIKVQQPPKPNADQPKKEDAAPKVTLEQRFNHCRAMIEGAVEALSDLETELRKIEEGIKPLQQLHTILRQAV